MKLTENQREIVEAFWMRCLEVADEEKREAFRVALRTHLAGDIYFRQYVDYDPPDALVDCLHAAEVECRGCLGSAAGIFPQKAGTVCIRDGVRIQIGRGGLIGVAHEVGDLDVLLEGWRLGPGWEG